MNQPSTPATNPNPADRSPIFLTGNVMMSDGTPGPPAVPIRIVCGTSNIRTESFTDPGGNFSIVLSGVSIQSLFGCDVRASWTGYISDEIPLDRQSPLDNPDVGTIYLHKAIESGGGEGYTVSLTTKLAPKDARKEYEKGLSSKKGKKWPEAEQAFAKAVALYPKYAIAWYELGLVYSEGKKFDDALHAQLQAVQADPKYVNPYGELTTLAFRKQQWGDVENYTAQLIKLSAFTTPEVYFYNAAANFNLHRIDEAEKSARFAAQLDDKHKVPRINYLLGLILEQKMDFKGAAENLRLYLQFSPAATDAASVQQQVAALEKANGGQ